MRDDLVRVVGRSRQDSMLLAAGPESFSGPTTGSSGVIGLAEFQAARV